MNFLAKSLIIAVGHAIIIAALPASENKRAAAKKEILQKKKLASIACFVRPEFLENGDEVAAIPLLTGWGDYRMRITGKNDSAHIYFQQGINLYYGFHIIESMASFMKSTQFDSSFAMGYWGIALAYGPNINDGSYAASPKAWEMAQKANALSGNCSNEEKALITAILSRYSPDSVQDRPALNRKYADEMKTVYQRFPVYPDAAALYADALMLLHPWNYYDKEGKDRPWTPELVGVLESLLKQTPLHPGAEHYYIHATEASDRPGRALEAARKLHKIMPGLAHPAHMPSHTFIRTGYYNEGVEVNQQAIKAYNNYLGHYPQTVAAAPLYQMHNLHMESACANMSGRYADAMKASNDLGAALDSSWTSLPAFDGIFFQYVEMTPYLTQIRFGVWDDILNTPSPNSKYVYSKLLWHYGQGMAYARKQKISQAETELANLIKEMKDEQLFAPAPPFANPGINGSRVAGKILEGVIAEEKKNYKKAIAALRQAVVYEDSMIYNEPRDWVHPSREYLGAVLIKAGQFGAAEKVFREDLVINPQNGWSYTGLWQSFIGQNKKKEAEKVQQMITRAFSMADKKIKTAVF